MTDKVRLTPQMALDEHAAAFANLRVQRDSYYRATNAKLKAVDELKALQNDAVAAGIEGPNAPAKKAALELMFPDERLKVELAELFIIDARLMLDTALDGLSHVKYRLRIMELAERLETHVRVDV